MAEKKTTKKTQARKTEAAPKKVDRTTEEHNSQQAQRDEANAEHLRRTNRTEGAPERISSAEETQRQIDADR